MVRRPPLVGYTWSKANSFAEFEADLIACAPARAWPSPEPGANCAASNPNCPADSRRNSAACTPRASIPSTISPNSSPSQDQPSIAHSTGVVSGGVKVCRQGLLIVPSPSGGGLGWGRSPVPSKVAVGHAFTLTPALSLKGEEELKDLGPQSRRH